MKIVTTGAALAFTIGAMATITATDAQATENADDAQGATETPGATAETGAPESPGVVEPRAVAPIRGCPYEDFCIYPRNAGWNGDRPSLKYHDYKMLQSQ